jgi:signal transduction histidine kinase/phage shock protein PspC (stress-responsive transcriptional regulator)
MPYRSLTQHNGGVEARANLLFRRADDRLITGTAAALARAVGVDPVVVRCGFVLLAALGGTGFVIYAGAYLLIPSEPPAERTASQDVVRVVGVGAAALALLGLTRAVGIAPLDPAIWPVLLVVIGALVLWRTSSGSRSGGAAAPTSREVLDRVFGTGGADGRGRLRALARIAVGLTVAIAGLVAVIAVNTSVGVLGRGLLAALVLLVGIGLLFGPWLWRLASDLTAERRERIRSQERAEMAAHLHDSVLHTLTLIQRHPERTADVARLARRQERELRAWLRDPDGELPAGTFAGQLRAAADQVEDDHGITVDAIFVGDAVVDERLRGLVAATGEALRNAARHAHVDEVSLYAEVGPGEVEVFVRDRGCGFDRGAVSTDRQGLTESIEGRLARLGGRARVRSALGEGTEVALRLPVDKAFAP